MEKKAKLVLVVEPELPTLWEYVAGYAAFAFLFYVVLAKGLM